MRKRAGPAPKDMTGAVSGKLTVLGLDESKHGHGAYWTSRCECGNVVSVRGDALRTGSTRSCGCQGAENLKLRKKHGHTSRLGASAIYGVWKSMRARCANPDNKAYKWYGGRGITCAPEWQEFDAFAADMAAGWAPGLTLERKDVNGGYNKENCCWVTQAQQMLNTRRNVWYETPQGRMVQKHAAALLGVTDRTLRRKRVLPDGWSRVQ